jgi:enoyl-CoA hydratase/carnithine racemase
MTSSEPLLVEREGPITWLTLNRPDQLNAITGRMLTRLDEELERERRSDARVIILRGAGRAFSAGHDLSSDSVEVTEPGDAVDDRDRQASYIDLFMKIWEHPKPVIASIHGYCMAGATQMVTFADLVITAEDAQIAASPVLPIGGGFISPLLGYYLGANRAKLLSFIPGYRMSGRQAMDWGWAVDSVPAADLHSRSIELALAVAKTPASVIRMKKIAINRTLELQGYRLTAYMGAETDVVVHHSDEVEFVKSAIEEYGFKETLRRFTAGELLTTGETG